MIVLLVVLNIVGVQEAAKLSITLAIVDFATQVLLVALGFVLVFSPEILVDNIHWGVAPTWGNLAIAIPVAMLAYTGVETVSNLAEEVRDPVKNVPNAYKLVAYAVFAIYFTLPLIALSALPVKLIDGEFTTLLALPPEAGGFANDPILGVVKNLGLEGGLLDVLEIYVGILAATILFIATNAGVIGASRITYSMATYRQIPEIFRRLHPRFKTPWLSILLFAGVAPIAVILPGDVQFVGTLYSLGATLSFTVAHASIVRMRMRPSGEELLYRARPNLQFRGIDWPLFAIFGGIATGVSFAVILIQNSTTRWVGLGWIAVGFGAYALYRRRAVGVPLRTTVKAPPAFGPALALEYRRLLVTVVPGQASDDAFDIAASLAAERGSQIIAVHVIEIPLDLPLGTEKAELEQLANRELDEARAIGESYGVNVIPRLLRGRNAGGCDRRGGRASRHRDHRHRRPQEGHRPAQARRVRRDRRLRAQERPVPSDGDRVDGGVLKLYRGAVAVLALLFVGIGVALLAVTAANGGGVLGFLLGGMFVALGVGRLTLLRKAGR